MAHADTSIGESVALAMGLGDSLAVWTPLLSGVVFALLFVVLKKGTPPTTE